MQRTEFLDKIYALVKKRFFLGAGRLEGTEDTDALAQEIFTDAEEIFNNEEKGDDVFFYLLGRGRLLPFECHVLCLLFCHAIRPECREACRSLNLSGSPEITPALAMLTYEREVSSAECYLALEKSSLLGKYYLEPQKEGGMERSLCLSGRMLHLLLSGAMFYEPEKSFIKVVVPEENSSRDKRNSSEKFCVSGILSLYGISPDGYRNCLLQAATAFRVPVVLFYLTDPVWEDFSCSLWDERSGRIRAWLRECFLWQAVPAVEIPEHCPQDIAEELVRFVSMETEIPGAVSQKPERRVPELLILSKRERKFERQDLPVISVAVGESPIGKAHRVKALFGLPDIVLPEKQKELIRQACDQVRFRETVYRTWQMDSVLSYGKGVSLLFSGPPGTGKTMAAQIVAAELGMELYRVSLPAVVSKYIGETEKNLEEIFRQAEGKPVVLFFDEADVLFGKRTEIKDSNDKYSNMEAAFLLQKIEEYEGVTILATNYRKNFDEAFSRRMKFVIDFPFPGKKERVEIWRRSIPEVLYTESLDLSYLGERFELSGSNIKNIVLHAAFLAAAEGKKTLTMKLLLEAVRHEYGKLGKVISERELGEYYLSGDC